MKTTNMEERMKSNLILLLLIHVEQPSESAITNSYCKELTALAQINIIQIKQPSSKETVGRYHYQHPIERSVYINET